jgi:ATP-dependent RNA helicase DDX10/DBP4
MVCQLRERKIPINKIQVNVSLMKSIGPKIASLLAADPEIKMAAQRAFLSYIRSCHVMSDKNVFDVKVRISSKHTICTCICRSFADFRT